MFIVIAGGGNAGSFVARQLLTAGHEVRVIEKSEEIIAERGGEVEAGWVWGDACDPVTDEEAEMGRADAVLALTGHDEDNLVISQLAKQEFGVQTVLARINNPHNSWLFDRSWGVDVAVSAPAIISQIVAEEVTLGDLVSLLKVAKGKFELVEMAIPEDSPAVGRPIAELALPQNCTLVAVLREDKTHIPRGDFILRAKDEVLAVTALEEEEALHRALLEGH